MASTSLPSSPFPHLHKVFLSFDEDGDGKLSANELSQCISKIGEHVSVEEAREFVKMFDSDGDGLLDFEEFMKIVEEGEDEKSRDLKAAFAMYESEGEGCITPKSLKRMLSKLGNSRDIEDCHEMICRYDLNGDGVLSFDEFQVMMMS